MASDRYHVNISGEETINMDYSIERRAEIKRGKRHSTDVREGTLSAKEFYDLVDKHDGVIPANKMKEFLVNSSDRTRKMPLTPDRKLPKTRNFVLSA